jgi:hypothetical protein
MMVISFIEGDALTKKIIIHLGLWQTKNHAPEIEYAHFPTIEKQITYRYITL